MVNDNIITQKMYKNIEKIVEKAFDDINCDNCSTEFDDTPCWCDIDYTPSEEYITKITRDICNTIGEPIEDLED